MDIMKNLEEQFEVVKIDQIVKVEEFKNFYESQSKDSEDQLKSSLEKEQLLPLITSRDFQLIDGYCGDRLVQHFHLCARSNIRH